MSPTSRPGPGAASSTPSRAASCPWSLEEAAFRLLPGGLSSVVEAPDGLYLLKLEERLPEVSVPLADARERIRGHLVELRGREVLEREVAALRAASKVEVLLPQ